ncbi:MAG TPA: acetyl/propionyl/methylcrotonyl-CoA carboxylase subunit alpha [Candidatus Saccharimonadia bacterium]|nr:acetyl/propionyl/methylcrotonyl-CoA carboxylase subunit alpha [Candidatus Saccharimonadia bacterium]
MFDKILIANRGEIACRVIRTCRRLGIATVAVYSQADATAQHVRLADEAWPIGGPRPAESYLRGDAILEVAQRSGAQAIHPGYGFLSENADFAEAVERAGLVFIGPRAASIRKMGSKAGAKLLMPQHGVPVVPGYTGEDQDPAVLAREAEKVGYPLRIKAAHGGGGKGMRIVRSAGEFADALVSCQREAKNAFGRDRVLLERYLELPRHIEFQVFGDAHGSTIHLNERECSAQRRYQKVIEETPSPFLTPERRAQMGAAAVAAARAIDYTNAGTVEFIVAPDGAFYFMEINTRLQVEHPVTEMTLGLDLVEWQLRVASGEPLPLSQDELRVRGHAIEVRLYAEDPEQGFLPGSGRLERLRLPPPSPHVRIDSGVVEGDTVTIFYDPMIAKLIAWDDDRPRALARLREALAQCAIAGPKSNIEFLERLVRHPVFVEGRIDTSYLDRHLEEVLPPPVVPADSSLCAVGTAALLLDEAESLARERDGTDPWSPWARADAWRLGHEGKRLECFRWRDRRFELAAHGHDGSYRIAFDGAEHRVEHARLDADVLSGVFDGAARRFRVDASAGGIAVHDGERRVRFERVPAYAFTASAAVATDRVLAPMPGRIVAVRAEVGASVAEGDELVVMEAMKMELTLRAPRAGTISTVQATVGDFVEADAVLVRMDETS